MISLLPAYQGKRVEIFIHSKTSPHVKTTYNQFNFYTTDNDNDIVLIDNPYEDTQSLCIKTSDIDKIEYCDSKDVYDTYFEIIGKDFEVELSVVDNRPRCCRCFKKLEDIKDMNFRILGTGGYGGKLDGESVEVHLCEDCLCELLGIDEKEIA
jgi:hypothetical protein